jgi:hypothetical protein
MHYEEVLACLRDALRLPPYVLRPCDASFRLVVDFEAFGSLSVPLKDTPSLRAGGMVMSPHAFSASFRYSSYPTDPWCKLEYRSDLLVGQAKECGIDPEALLEILTLHECVHIAMMLWWCKERTGHFWLGTESRHLHEAVALYFCEHGLPDLVRTASRSDIQKYVAFVEACIKEGHADGVFYEPYFKSYRTLPPQDVWPAIKESLGEQLTRKLIEAEY